VTFAIIWSKRAFRKLRKLERPVGKRIYEAVGSLKEDPFKHDVVKLTNSPYYRLRVGGYRIIMDIGKNELRILVLKVGHRRKVYD
jgi:mRNA interferase RelE/StbE